MSFSLGRRDMRVLFGKRWWKAALGGFALLTLLAAFGDALGAFAWLFEDKAVSPARVAQPQNSGGGNLNLNDSTIEAWGVGIANMGCGNVNLDHTTVRGDPAILNAGDCPPKPATPAVQ